jgi:putative redox protein
MADVDVELRWAGDLRFEGGRPGGPQLLLDGDGAAGASPVQLLMLSLAGCMAADIVDIGQRMRVPIGGLVVRASGDRAAQPPRRYTRIRLTFEVSGSPAADAPKLERALELSREKYCSVLHTLQPDLPVEFSLQREPG